MQEKSTFKSQVNGLPFDVENPTTGYLLGSHHKSQFVREIETDEKTTVTKNRKPKIAIDSDDELEQDVK